MGIDVHGRADVRVPQQFLYILRCCSAFQQIAGIGVTELMEVEVPNFRQGFSQTPKEGGNSRWVLIIAVVPQTNKVDWDTSLGRSLVPVKSVQVVERPVPVNRLFVI